MNHCVPAWNFEGDLPVTNHKESMGPEHELVELLWQNGQVVLNSQTHRKLNDQPRNVSFENSGHLVQDEETVSWIHNSFEDCFEEELCSTLFNDLPSMDHVHSHKSHLPNHAVTPSEQRPNRVPPPRFQLPGSSPGSLVGFKKITNLPKVPVPTKGDTGASGGSGTFTQGKVRQGSAMEVRSSHCGSNQTQNDPDWSGIGHTGLSARPLRDNLHKAIQTTGPALTTSSGGSDSSFGRTCRQSTDDFKRKRADGEQSPSQSEAAELDSAGGCKSSSKQSKRSRAAEVHNLSERRRRDRINEKMKALQELIPHCSKTDKASMLDEAIEYLKSLQLQLQVMWMGGGMGPSPMMFPGVQQYMSQMSMGMGSPSLASRLPLTNHSMSVAQTPNQSVNYPNQMQSPSLPEQYAHYMGFLQMQNATQPLNMNMFKFSSQAVQQSQPMVPPVSNIGTFSCGATANKITSG